MPLMKNQWVSWNIDKELGIFQSLELLKGLGELNIQLMETRLQKINFPLLSCWRSVQIHHTEVQIKVEIESIHVAPGESKSRSLWTRDLKSHSN